MEIKMFFLLTFLYYSLNKHQLQFIQQTYLCIKNFGLR